ncbi:MAG TPA: site-specific DNA-methyltransferase, partial [Solirubrobacteraceae bacterium]|nr:site-specific DNA-methyltransferase [Solirubrobacteraceae bacterium]
LDIYCDRCRMSESGNTMPSSAANSHVLIATTAPTAPAAGDAVLIDGRPHIAYSTDQGVMYKSTIETFLDAPEGQLLRGQVQLVFTSPPFPLNRKKKYGNLNGQEYVEWLGGLGAALGDLLTEDGSLVVELGNAWEPGEPVMSTLALEALIAIKAQGDFHLCQQFVVHNPARLPSPAQWVNVDRCRLKDAYTNVWWLSRTSRPKADNRKVLVEYSDSMKKLIQRQRYNAGGRPSQHNIGQRSFLQDHGGAIPSNVIKLRADEDEALENLLEIPNTVSTDAYRRYCKEHELTLHPARMPRDLAEFFIRFLTDEGDLVLDPFGGSNTTGATAEALERDWISTEPNADYIAGSQGRFLDFDIRIGEGRAIQTNSIIRYLGARDQPATRHEIVTALAIEASPEQWSRELGLLVEDGVVGFEGRTKGRRYFLEQPDLCAPTS